MPPSEPYYAVQVPMIGQPEDYYTICRCVTVDSAMEVVRILLETKDPAITTIRVIRGVGMNQ